MSKTIQVGNKVIGEGHGAFIIAEMSANHAGDIERAIEIIHAAKESGADCIKIQTYTPDTMTIDSDKPYFQIETGAWKGENLYQLYSKAYTPWEWQKRLKEEAEALGLLFLSTPFDKTSVDFLEELGVLFYKVASFELTDLPLVSYIASKGKPMIISTGMGTYEEIEEAVKVIKETGNHQICLLKCSSAYPAIPNDMNLLTMKHMKESFDIVVGLSDHSLGAVAAIAGVAMGAQVIEKHFCISRKIKNPDSFFSMEPEEFKQMVDDIRSAERAIGTVSYAISEKEKESLRFRRSIFVVKDIKCGEVFTEENIRVIRPSNGLEPKYYYDVLGKRACEMIERGTPLEKKHIESFN